MSDPLKCAVCGIVITTAEGEMLVATDAGPVHRECFEGPVPPGSEASIDDLELTAENERRRDHGEPEIVHDDWIDGFSDQYAVSTEGVEAVPPFWRTTTDGSNLVDGDKTPTESEPPRILDSLNLPAVVVSPAQKEQAERALGIGRFSPRGINVDERSARRYAAMEREDLDTPLDPDRRQ